MELIIKKLPSTHNHFIISDFHLGTICSSEDGINKTIKHILSEPNNYVSILGDLCECIMLDDPRFSLGTRDKKNSLPLKQYKAATELLKPIKNRIITILLGNHDWNLARTGGDPIRILCDELGVPYGGYTTKLIIKDTKGNIQHKMFFTHGRKVFRSNSPDPIRKEANMLHQLRESLRYKAGDCILMACGHAHRLLTCFPSQELWLSDDGENIKQKYTESEESGTGFIHPDHRYYVCAGSYLRGQIKGVTSYSELFNYDPLEVGYCVAHVENKKIQFVEKVVLN
jgi:predicted phosphodiesterase